MTVEHPHTVLIGHSTLSRELATRLSDAVIVGRPQYDLSDQVNCDQLIKDHAMAHTVIYTAAVQSDRIWDSSIVNFVTPMYLSLRWLEQNPAVHVILISSASAWWPSYPGLSTDRFVYKFSKRCISEFVQHVNRCRIDSTDTAVISVIEPGSFQSPMSGWQGMSCATVAQQVMHVIQTRAQHVTLLK